MILYTVAGKAGRARYLNLGDSGDLAGKNVYVNITNRCPCSCVFCLHRTKKEAEGDSLWFKDGDPGVEAVMEEFASVDLSAVRELVFCGFGEPLERLDDVCAIVDRLKAKRPDLKVRVNTNGLANLIHGKDVTPELKGRFDTVSISLNAPDAEEFLALTRSRFGIRSYEALKDFAVKAKRFVPNVVLTVVEKVMSEEKIEICRRTCAELGVALRVRPFED